MYNLVKAMKFSLGAINRKEFKGKSNGEMLIDLMDRFSRSVYNSSYYIKERLHPEIFLSLDHVKIKIKSDHARDSFNALMRAMSYWIEFKGADGLIRIPNEKCRLILRDLDYPFWNKNGIPHETVINIVTECIFRMYLSYRRVRYKREKENKQPDPLPFPAPYVPSPRGVVYYECNNVRNLSPNKFYMLNINNTILTFSGSQIEQLRAIISGDVEYNNDDPLIDNKLGLIYEAEIRGKQKFLDVI